MVPCRSEMLSPCWLVEGDFSCDLYNFNRQLVRGLLQHDTDFDAYLILLVPASAGKLHAKANICNTMAAYEAHEEALFHLRVSYENDRGVQKDLRLAAHFNRLAATRHPVATQYNLAVMTANGKGVKHD